MLVRRETLARQHQEQLGNHCRKHAHLPILLANSLQSYREEEVLVRREKNAGLKEKTLSHSVAGNINTVNPLRAGTVCAAVVKNKGKKR